MGIKQVHCSNHPSWPHCLPSTSQHPDTKAELEGPLASRNVPAQRHLGPSNGAVDFAASGEESISPRADRIGDVEV